MGKPPQRGEMMKLPMRIASELNQLADSYDESLAQNLFAHFLRNGIWQTPTLSVKRIYASIGDDAMYSDARQKYAAPEERDQGAHNPIVHIDVPEYVPARRRALDEAERITREGHAAGVRFLAGTDSGGVPYLYMAPACTMNSHCLSPLGLRPCRRFRPQPAILRNFSDCAMLAQFSPANVLISFCSQPIRWLTSTTHKRLIPLLLQANCSTAPGWMRCS